MKRFLSIFLTAIMVLSLCACSGSTGGGNNNSTPPPADPGNSAAPEAPAAGTYDVTEPITITWWHALEDQYTEAVNEIVENFNKSQDLITVEAKYMGAYKDINEALVAAHAAGEIGRAHV